MRETQQKPLILEDVSEKEKGMEEKKKPVTLHKILEIKMQITLAGLYVFLFSISQSPIVISNNSGVCISPNLVKKRKKRNTETDKERQ